MSSDAAPTPYAQSKANLTVIFPIGLIILFGFFSIGIPLAAFPTHIKGTLGLGNIWVGVVLGLQSVATLLTRHHSGTVADMLGARIAVRRGVVLTVVSGLISMLSLTFATTTSLALLLVSRVVLGFGESFLITGCLAWGIGLLGPARSGRVMAWSGIAMYGAIAASAPLSLFLAGRYGFPSVVGAATLFPIFAGVVTFLLPAAPILGKERMPFYRIINKVWRSGVGLSLSAVGFAGLAGFAVLLFQEKGWENASLMMTTFGIAYIGARLLFGHTPDKYGGRRIAMVSIGIEMIGQALVWQAPSPLFAFVGAALTGAGYSLAFPAFGVEAVKAVEPQFKGIALGAYVAFFDLALGATGPIAGLVANGFGYSSVYLFGFISCFFAALLALRI